MSRLRLSTYSRLAVLAGAGAATAGVRPRPVTRPLTPTCARVGHIAPTSHAFPRLTPGGLRIACWASSAGAAALVPLTFIFLLLFRLLLATRRAQATRLRLSLFHLAQGGVCPRVGWIARRRSPTRPPAVAPVRRVSRHAALDPAHAPPQPALAARLARLARLRFSRAFLRLLNLGHRLSGRKLLLHIFCERPKVVHGIQGAVGIDCSRVRTLLRIRLPLRMFFILIEKVLTFYLLQLRPVILSYRTHSRLVGAVVRVRVLHIPHDRISDENTPSTQRVNDLPLTFSIRRRTRRGVL